MKRAIFVAALLLAGCGSSSGPIKNVSPTTSSSTQGAKTFSAPGMALHFQFPAAMRTIELAPATHVVGNARRSTRAAVGLGPFDLLVVIRYPNRPLPVTTSTIPLVKRGYDRAMTRAFGAPLTSRITSVGSLPALSYGAVAAPGLPVQATTRNTLVFVGSDEYQLICQYTTARKTAINAACDQMLSTMSAKR
jgi:hypothetical protein